MSWLHREEDADEMIRSGRAALMELTGATSRLSVFVQQLEKLVAEERQARAQQETSKDAHA